MTQTKSSARIEGAAEAILTKSAFSCGPRIEEHRTAVAEFDLL